MTLFSWLFLVTFIIAYVASVGFSLKMALKSISLGEALYYDKVGLFLVGPFYCLRETISENVLWCYVGIKLLVDSEYREQYIKDEIMLDEEES